MRNHALALAAVLAATSGCSLMVKTDDLEPLADAKGFCQAYDGEIYRAYTRCYGLDPSFAERLYTLNLPYCDAGAASVSAGRMAYDRDSAESCLSTITSAGCQVFYVDLSVCDRALRGVAGPNAACTQGTDCDPVTTRGCIFTGNTCPGKCAAPATAGAPCGNGCADGLVCDYSSTTTCLAAPGEGAACVSGQCGAGLFCNSGTCQRYGRTGVACAGSYQCDDNFFCDPARTPTTCQPYPEQRVAKVGQRCDYPWYCADGLWCDPDMPLAGTTLPTCQPKISSGACSYGEQCQLPTQCLPGTSGYACRTPGGAGAACKASNGDCRFGLTCDAVDAGASGTCVYPGAIGESCGSHYSEYRPCGAGWCDVGTYKCTAFLPLGAACSNGGDDPCSPGGVTAACLEDPPSSGTYKCVDTCI